MLTDFFLKRPTLAWITSVFILLTGALALKAIPLRQYPNLQPSAIQVQTGFLGADAGLMEAFVTTPLEVALSGLNGVDTMTSVSNNGLSTLLINLNLGTPIESALSDVISRVTGARWQLPKGVDDPSIQKVDPNADPFIYLAVTSQALSSIDLTDMMIQRIQPVLQSVKGVGSASILGGHSYAVRTTFNPITLQGLNLTTDDLANAFQQQNTHAPSGTIRGTDGLYHLVFNNPYRNAESFANLPVRSFPAQRAVQLRELGGWVRPGAYDVDSNSTLRNEPSIFMGIASAMNANPIEVSGAVQRAIATLQKTLPPSVKIQRVWDASVFIQQSIDEVVHTMGETSLVVILMILAFLGSWRLLLVPALTIPLSLSGAVALMHLAGYTLNTLTLLALVLAIGMVVDDAIVVLENIYRHRSSGMNVHDAARQGAHEIQWPVVAMTMTLVAVFAPIGLMHDLTGVLFREFAFTMMFAVLVSGVVALTASPSMCAKVLAQPTHSRWEQWVDHLNDHVSQAYERALTTTLRFRKLVGLVMVAVLAASAWMYLHTPSELVPTEDVGAVLSIVKAPPNANLDYVERVTHKVAKLFASVPEQVGYAMINGMNGPNTAFAVLILKPWNERQPIGGVIQGLFQQLMAIPEALVFPFNPFQVPGISGFQPVQFVIKSYLPYDQLQAYTQKLMAALSQHPGLVNLDTDLKLNRLNWHITYRQDRMDDVGVTAHAIDHAVQLATGEPRLSDFSYHQRAHYVVPSLTGPYRSNQDGLNLLGVRGASGAWVPLRDLITVTPGVGSDAGLPHFDLMHAVTLKANLTPGYHLGQALHDIRTTAQGIFPPGTQYDTYAQSRSFVQAQGKALVLFLAALVTIYLILAIQYDSLLDPLIILVSVPLAALGALLMIKAQGSTINIYTNIGLVTLIGLISKHGILMVDFANHLLSTTQSPRDAIIQAAKIRLRPVLITTFAMVLGAVPLWLASGAGAAARNQMGGVMVGGMLIGTLFTLFVVPSVYTVLKPTQH